MSVVTDHDRRVVENVVLRRRVRQLEQTLGGIGEFARVAQLRLEQAHGDAIAGQMLRTIEEHCGEVLAEPTPITTEEVQHAHC